MADIWTFSLLICCLLLLVVLLYFLHKHYISENDGSLVVADTNKQAHTEDDRFDRQTDSPFNQEPMPIKPIKAERKIRKTPKDPVESSSSDNQRVTEKGKEVERQKQRSEENDYGRSFIEEFDKRDARRKQLKKENEEKLKSLLNWTSPFSDRLAQKRYPETEKYKKVSFVERDLTSIKKETLPRISQAGPEEEKLTKLKEKPAQTVQPAVKENPRLAGEGVRKIINFVAISSRQVAPAYKPRNKLNHGTASSGSEVVRQPPQRVERRRRVPTPTPRKKVKVNTPEVVECSDHVEDVDDIQVEVGEEATAAVRVSDHLCMAEETLTDTSFNFEKEPPRPSSLEFSQYQRNFITDRLFAGNIYVGEGLGGQLQSDLEERKEEEGSEENCSSWRERYQRKMSS